MNAKFVLTALFILHSAMADSDEALHPQAVSKEVYDLYIQAHKIGERLESEGLDLDSIRAEDLPFSSANLKECARMAMGHSADSAQYEKKLYACSKRHPFSPDRNDAK